MARLKRGVVAAALFLLLLPLAMAGVAALALRHQLYGNLYHLANLAIAYPDFGAVRRGLAGTLVWASGLGLRSGAVAFYIACAGGFAAGASWLVARWRAEPLVLAAFAVVLAGLVRFWALDMGRADILVALLLMLAAAGAGAGRWVPACFCVAVALFAHETGFIYGVPLLLALAWAGPRRPGLREAALGLGVLAAGLLLYLGLGWLPHSDAGAIAAAVRGELPRAERVDQALYFALAGGRGVRMAVCQNLADPNWALHGASGVLLILLAAFALAGTQARRWSAALLASLPPFAALWMVANDMSRWAAFSLLGVFLVGVVLPAGKARLGWARLACAALVFALHSPTLAWVDYPILVTSPVIDNVAHRLGAAPTPSLEAALERCDPGWRAVIEPRAP